LSPLGQPSLPYLTPSSVIFRNSPMIIFSAQKLHNENEKGVPVDHSKSSLSHVHHSLQTQF
jgi:hypothetical protein